MSIIHVKHRHNLARDKARARVEQVAKRAKSRLKGEYFWRGDSLHFHRSGASGAYGFIHVDDAFVELKVKLGLVLAPMRVKIEGYIRKGIGIVLAESNANKWL